MGLHAVDTLTWILGPIARVTSIAKHQAVSYKLHDTCATLFELASGVTGTLGSHLACPRFSVIRMYGTRANIEARNQLSELIVEPLDPSQPCQEYRFGPMDTLAKELTDFDAACSGKAPYPVTPAEAVRNIAVLEAIMKSSAAGSTWVDVAVR